MKTEYQETLKNNETAMHFYFKVNNSKLQDEIRLKNQIEKVIKRLIKRNNINSKSVELLFGTVEDDFIFNRFRLCISYVK